MSIQPSTLHYVAAFLYAATIPKHTRVGMKSIDPAVRTIHGTANEKAKKLLTPTWQHCNLWLITSALMSLKWAKTGGPVGTEEKVIVWAQVAFGIVTGYQYFKHDMYPGLACLWAAPAATVAAMMWHKT